MSILQTFTCPFNVSYANSITQITSNNISTRTVYTNNISDINGSIGSIGTFLSKNTNGIQWITPTPTPTPSLSQVCAVGNTTSIIKPTNILDVSMLGNVHILDLSNTV